MGALDLPPGARVPVPSFTGAAVSWAVVHATCVPVLAEMGHDRMDLEAGLPNAGAIPIRHMRGHISDVDRIPAASAATRGPKIQVLGRPAHNARAFRNRGFVGPRPDIPATRAMLMRARGLRLPAPFTGKDRDRIARVLLAAMASAVPREVAAA